MTILAPHAPGPTSGPASGRARRGPPLGRRRQWSGAHPAWPVTALLAGYPFWWALGLGDLSVLIIAVPMVLRMHAWHRAGRPVKVPPAFGLWLMFLVVVGAGIAILGLTMLLATGCGQVDMVLVTTGRSSWSLANGLLAVAVNVALDLVLIPRYGITGAAIGWSAAIALTNLLPLAQIAAAQRLHPFGRGTAIAAALSAFCFGVLPLTARTLPGPGPATSLTAIAAGGLVMAAGLWRFRTELNLAAMPARPS